MLGNTNNNIEAQFGYETIDKLTVGELIVRKDIRVMGDDMDPRVHISWDRNGGRVVTYGPKGSRCRFSFGCGRQWRCDNAGIKGENRCVSHGERGRRGLITVRAGWKSQDCLRYI